MHAHTLPVLELNQTPGVGEDVEVWYWWKLCMQFTADLGNSSHFGQTDYSSTEGFGYE